jgi:outer membrane protein OmpA-like peptidoglycan-associated protein
MKNRAARLVTGLLVAAVAAGCAEPPKKPTYSERIVLLPNKDGRSSAVIVSRDSGEQKIDKPYESVELVGGKEERRELAKEDVEQRYGEVLSVQPARPFTYTLYFNMATTDLTPQSRASLNEVTQKIKDFPAAQVTVIGHTDRLGTEEYNDALSLKRAAFVRDMLVKIGIPREAIEIVGRGEREPLVPTADRVAEERNRRVEIKLR